MALPPITHLLYLHGFRSSPQSLKARQTAVWVQRHRPGLHWCCPQLPPSPREAIERLAAVLAGWPPAERCGVIGSSLGGYYAAVLAQRFGCRAVLLNPAMQPARDLARHIGELRAWHSDERFFFRAEFIDELAAMEPGMPTHPQRCLAIVAKGDELLDWTETCARLQGCRIELLEGGDHALSDYERHLPEIAGFFGL